MIHLDYQKTRRYPLGGSALLGLALMGLLLLVGAYRETAQKAALLEARLARIEQPAQQRQAGGAGGGDLDLEVKNANEILRQLTVPWDQLFDAVDAAGDKDVALLGLEPDLSRKIVKVSGEARNIPAMLEYVARLQEQGSFGAVYLQNHMVQQSVAERPVQFTAIAAWEYKP